MPRRRTPEELEGLSPTVTESADAEPVAERRDPRPNVDVYEKSIRTNIEGLDPDFHYQLVNTVAMNAGELSEAERKLRGEEKGYEGAGYMKLQWEVVPRHTVKAALRDDDSRGLDTTHQSGGQVLMRIPKTTWEMVQGLEEKHLKNRERQLTEASVQNFNGQARFSGAAGYGWDTTTGAVQSMVTAAIRRDAGLMTPQ